MLDYRLSSTHLAALAASLALTACSGGDDGRDDASAGSTAGTDTVGTTDGTTAGTETGASATTGTATQGSSTATTANETMGTTASTDATDGTATTTDGTTDGTTDATTGPLCPAMCEEDGGVCLGPICCAEDSVCGDVCCGDGEVCSFNTCVVPGATCIDATECADGEYCEYSLGDPEMMGGEMCQGQQLKNGKCLPSPPECGPGEEPKEGEPITCLAKCEFVPDGTFSPVVKHHWDKGTVMMAPIVIQLDDDNCDMSVDERDIPEIVFSEFKSGQYNNNGTLHAISIVQGQMVTKWSVNFATDRIQPGREIAGGNIDGVPGNEIVVCTEEGKVRALDAAGQPLWISDAGTCVQPTIADLDGDGAPEVLVEGRVLDGKTGALKVNLPNSSYSTAADLDLDGQLDVVHARGAFNAAGGVMATTGLEGTFPAVADLDLDGVPEVAVIANGGALLPHHLVVWRYNKDMPNGVEIIRNGIDINGPLSPALCPMGSAGNTKGGGPPTIADFNGDGTPDVAVAGGVGYAVFDGTKLMDPNVPANQTILWIKQTKDCSSAATGSSVFDFDGDGSAEVVYSDEHYLRVYRGSNGDVLFQTCNTTGTLREFPLIADVDNDSQADIVAVSNNYSSIVCEGGKQTGVRIFGDVNGQWVRTRRIWNQHAYHVTNVLEDGTIPAQEAVNWTTPGLNNFRQNVQPEGEFAAPDLVVTLRRQCPPLDYGLVGRVRNIGEASAPAGVPVYFYEGDPDMGGTLLGMGMTTKVLFPAEAEDVLLLLPNAPMTVLDGSSTIWVVVDDPMPMHEWHECRVDNNRGSGSGLCPMAG